MKARRRHRGVTLVEVLVVGGVIATLALLLLLVLSANRTASWRSQSSFNLRGTHQGLVSFAQSSKYPSREGFFPGRTRTGEISMTPWGAQFARHISSSDGGYPAYRFAVILDTGNLPPRNAIHPAEADIKQEAVPGAEVTTANFSYAMLRLDAEGRLAEWRETINPDAPVLSDRMIGTVASPQSVWTQPGEGRWAGHVIFNDGRAEWIDAASPVIRNTRYGDGATVAVDHLFMPDDADAKGNTDTNAAMVFATDRDHENQK